MSRTAERQATDATRYHGLSPYVAALRQALNETDRAAAADFDDDGDYIFLHYDIFIENDFEIQEAMQLIDSAIQRIHQQEFVNVRH